MNIFVGNLPATVTTGKLRELFDGHGTIINAIVMRDVGTGLPLGYGHVYLIPEEAAYEAIVKLHTTMLKGSPVIVRECVYRAEPERRVHRRSWKGAERRVAGSRRHHGYEYAPTITQQQHTG